MVIYRVTLFWQKGRVTVALISSAVTHNGVDKYPKKLTESYVTCAREPFVFAILSSVYFHLLAERHMCFLNETFRFSMFTLHSNVAVNITSLYTLD